MGRLATEIALVLQGKHKPTYVEGQDTGDYVVVTNCKELKVSGLKMKQKTYWSHSTKPGHLKLTTMEDMALNKGHGELLRRAVRGMLPRNSLRFPRLNRLKLVEGSKSPLLKNIVAFHDEQPLVKEREKKKKNGTLKFEGQEKLVSRGK